MHRCFKLNGISYNKATLKQKAEVLLHTGQDFEKDIAHFLLLWLNDALVVEVKTSGSTGQPKHIFLSKKAMEASAQATATFFKLPEKTVALLCLPATYIAGKMMLVRALVLGWELDYIPPKTKLKLPNKHYNFAAMVPMQLQSNLKSIENIQQLIVGGAKVPISIIAKLQALKTKVYETYGMTETITHIAIKPLNTAVKVSAKGLFKVLPDVTISNDERGCLVITALKLSKSKIVTNDVVKLHSKTTFEWLGRYDNVINSGGVKLFPEQIEQQLQHNIKERFFISSEPDAILGSRVILIVETDCFKETLTTFKNLKPYEKPKKIYCLPKFKETNSGKVQRLETLKSRNIV